MILFLGDLLLALGKVLFFLLLLFLLGAFLIFITVVLYQAHGFWPAALFAGTIIFWLRYGIENSRRQTAQRKIPS